MATNRSAIAIPKLTLTGAYTLTPFDDGVQFLCSTDLSVTTPTGLGSLSPTAVVVPPLSGNLTVVPTGGTTINGAASSVTRDFLTNPLGVAISPNPYVATDYIVSGS